MTTLGIRAALAAVVGVAGAVAAGVAAGPDAPPRAKVEIRRAETKPADGLTEAKVVGTSETVYLHPTAELTEKDIASAAVGDGPSVEITLTADGAKKLAKLSAEHADRPLAILVDGKVVAAPVVRAKLGATVRISGNFTKDDAEKLAKAINGG